MNEPRWLTKPGVLAFHQEMLQEYGGALGVRDEGMLDSALDRPKNKWHYEGADHFTLAAAYGYGICQNHPFIDGNKRTAFVAVAVFLLKNGHRLVASEPNAYATMIRVAAGQMGEEELTVWLHANTTVASGQ